MTFSLLWFWPLFVAGSIISFLSPFLVKKLGPFARFPILTVPLAFSLFSTLAIFSLSDGRMNIIQIPWVSFLSLDLSFHFDGLGLLFSLLISFFGLLIFFYAGEYLKGHRDLGKFYLYILIFMLSMIGLVLSDHLLLLFVFWELTTFSSFLLIGFEHEKESARASAWQAILVTTVGALAMMAGLLLLGSICGTFRISEILQMGEAVISSEYYPLILILILLGAFTKSAQFPFYFWLPGAMAAPTPVSAYLHSATMVKAGIYLLARLSPVLAGTTLWTEIVSTVGGLTIVYGGLLALKQDDLKLLLAYMTVMALGILTLLLGIGSTEAIKAFVIFLLVHSFYKGALFLVAGCIDHGAHTRKISELGGLFKIMPWTAVAAGIALLSMGGIPPVIGFIGKELIYKAAVVNSGLVLLLLLSMGISTALSGVFFFKVFFGPRLSQNDQAHENNVSLWGPPLLLGIVGLCMGLFPGWMESSFIISSVSAIKGEAVTSALFSGVKFDRVLFLSALSTSLGVILYFVSGRVKTLLIGLSPSFALLSTQSLYDRGLAGLMKFAHWQTKLMQRGYLVKYLFVILVTFIVALGASLLFGDFQKGRAFSLPNLEIYEWVLSALIIGAVCASIVTKTFLGVVMLLGVVGYSVAILFVLYGAPDLALTQFLIETLTIIFIALIGIKFPESFSVQESKHNLISKGVVAISFGSLMSIILWNVMSGPFDPYLSTFYGENSYTLGKGRNIVNVILVDFRVFDTLGEITVLTVAAFGFFSIIKMVRRSREIK